MPHCFNEEGWHVEQCVYKVDTIIDCQLLSLTARHKETVTLFRHLFVHSPYENYRITETSNL